MSSALPLFAVVEGAWLDKFTDVVNLVDDKVWGTSFEIGGIPVPLLIVLILFGGVLLTVRLGGLQFRKLPLALRYMLRNEKVEDGAKGEVSSFGALCTALSATIGTGNIVGVATAYVAGGPGAIFWMWLAALFGMATKYAEGLLAVKYRDHDEATGHVLGGPFYYIEKGMGPKWKWLACLFAFFGVLVGLFGIGTFTQVNSICGAIRQFFDPDMVHKVTILGNDYSWVTVGSSVVLAVLVGLVVIGGLKRIAKVSEKVIPLMVVLYVCFAFVLVAYNVAHIPSAVATIVKSAFGWQAAAGGALGAIVVAMQKGIARGIFSNEAGLGSAPIAAAAAQTQECVRQGLVSMTGTFLDTIVVCSMTGLALTMTNQPTAAVDPNAATGAAATMKAFAVGLPFLPTVMTDALVMVSLVLFGFTTILGWDYYSERCLEYLTNGRMGPVLVYRWLYIAAVFIGPYMTISAVWGIADIVNGLMAVPNMIALIALSGVVAYETKDYFRRLKANEIND
ncbi:MAG: sodium:alanine symporter family protein [bacterium]|nr:sodium:alanine symporter family protein [bacterium]